MTRFAFLLVSYNSEAYLERCLDGLERLEGRPLGESAELIIIDNASTDRSREILERRKLGTQLLPESNLGFAGALNLGIRHCSAPWVISLNPDVRLQPDFLVRLSEAAESLESSPRIGMLVPKLRRIGRERFLAAGSLDSKALDSTGVFLDRMRRPYDRGQGSEDVGQFDRELEVFGPCGAAGVYRRSMLEELAVEGEIFDETFFTYYEDVDLAWRGQRAGWQARFVPAAVGFHVRAGSDRVRRQVLSAPQRAIAARAHANRLLVLVKNESFRPFVADAPLLLSYELARQFYVLFRHPRLMLQAARHLWRDVCPTLRKRRPRAAGVPPSPLARLARPRPRPFKTDGTTTSPRPGANSRSARQR